MELNKITFTNIMLDNLNNSISDNGKVDLEHFINLTNKTYEAINYSCCCTGLLTCYSTELDKIEQLQQTKASIRHQLNVLRVFANKLGLYDACDYLKKGKVITYNVAS